MAWKIFGFEIVKKKKEVTLPSPVPPADDDGGVVVASPYDPGGVVSQVLDLEGIIKTENDLLKRYRQIAQYHEADNAIDEIVNEAIVSNEKTDCVEINLDDTELSEKIKDKVREEFRNIKDILDFENKGHELFRQWYIDGRVYFHILIDEKNVKQGIVELRQIDPRKIRLVKRLIKEKDKSNPMSQANIIKGIEKFYIFNDKGITEGNVVGLKIHVDSIVHCSSGLRDSSSGMVLSHMHKAIKPVTNLKTVEDATVIYRLSRAPERRIFYIDVGAMSRVQAERYVNHHMQKYRNKITYDSGTGEVRDDKLHLAMTDDFWMPRREGGKGTEITTLPGAENLGNIEDIQYFQEKLFRSLNVPIGRLQPQQGFSLGRTTEITRDEVKFNKFILRVRKRFADIFSQALRIQLIAKEIIREDEWEDLSKRIRYDFIEDNHFSEFKDQEVRQMRIQNLQLHDPYIGRFFSQKWIMTNILNMDEDEIEKMQKEIEEELAEQEQMGADPNGQMPVDAAGPMPAAGGQAMGGGIPPAMTPPAPQGGQGGPPPGGANSGGGKPAAPAPRKKPAPKTRNSK